MTAPVHPAIARELARRRMEDFTRYTWPTYQWNWHHRGICTYLDALTAGTIKRLMVLAPPRHGKSELASRRFPAYYLGRQPDHEVMQLSYSADLAGAMNRDVQRVIDSRRYAGVFPGTRLAGGRGAGRRAKRTDNLFEVVGRKGRLRSTGILGGIAGMGFHLGIVDDPYKNAEEALSLTIRQKVLEEYRSSFLTRQYPDAAILLIQTRWHHDDLAGTLLREDPTGWEVLSFPAVSEDARHPADERTGPGQPLWPARFDLPFLNTMQASVGSLWWEALYQQRPMPAGGLLFRRQWFGQYVDGGTHWVIPGRRPIPKATCTVFGTVDPAASEKQSADCTAIPVGALTEEGDLLLLDVVNERLTPDKIPKRMLEVARQHGLEFYGVEDSGFQVAVINQARRLAGMPPIRELSVAGRGKVVRATPAIIKAEAGQVFVPAHTGPQNAPPWLMPFFEQVEKFRGGDEANDMVDGFAWLVRMCPRATLERSNPDADLVLERLSLRDREPTARGRGMWGR